mmetsp:Transcript_56765/g.168627  ORF Transcript_56765/g.168627 Transcript_56765/m.168627 type:complete len:237 (+) Transcript_56765:340-1050(+)
MHGPAVRARVGARELVDGRNLLRRVGPHRDDKVAREGTDARVAHARVEHGHVDAHFDLPRRQPRPLQERLPRKGAAEEEADHLIVPQRRDVGHLLRQLAVPPHAVLGHVGPQIRAGCDAAGARVARVGDVEQRAGARILEAELEEVERVGAMERHKIGLHEAGHKARRLAGVLLVAAEAAELGSGRAVEAGCPLVQVGVARAQRWAERAVLLERARRQRGSCRGQREAASGEHRVV